MNKPLYGLDVNGQPRLLSLSNFGMPTQTGSYYGLIGNGVLDNNGNVIGGTDESSLLNEAFADCDAKNMLLQLNSRQTAGGTGCYLYGKTLTLGPYMSLGMGGNFLRALGTGHADGSFTLDSSGFSIHLTQESAGDPLVQLHGFLKSSIDLTVWGPNASNAADKPPIVATGWVGTGYITGNTFVDSTTTGGTLAIGMNLTGKPFGGSPGVIPGTYITGGSTGAWTVNKTHTQAVGTVGTPLAMVATNDIVLTGVGIDNCNAFDLSYTVVGFGTGVMYQSPVGGNGFYLINHGSTRSIRNAVCNVGFSATGGSSGENVSFPAALFAGSTNSMGVGMNIYEDGTTTMQASFLGSSSDYGDWPLIWGSGIVRMSLPGHLENCNQNPLAYISCAVGITRAELSDIAPAYNSTGYAGAMGPGGRAALIWLDSNPDLHVSGWPSGYGQPYNGMIKVTNGNSQGSAAALKIDGVQNFIANAAAAPSVLLNRTLNPTFDLTPLAAIPGWALDYPPNNYAWNLISNGQWSALTTSPVSWALGQTPFTGAGTLAGQLGLTVTVQTVVPTPSTTGPTLPTQLQVNISGTASGAGTFYLLFAAGTALPMAQGAQVVGGFYASLASGTNITGIGASCFSLDSTGANIGTVGFGSATNVAGGVINRSLIETTNPASFTVSGTCYAAFGMYVAVTANTSTTATILIDTPFLGPTNAAYFPVATRFPTGLLPNISASATPSNPFRLGLVSTLYATPSQALIAGTRALSISNTSGTGLAAAWPAAAGSTPYNAANPGIKTTIAVSPGNSVLGIGYVLGAYIGGVGFLMSFRDAAGNALGGSYPLGYPPSSGVAYAQYVVDTITVTAGMSGASDSIVVGPDTFTSSASGSAGFNFNVTGTVAHDAPSLLAALKASSTAPYNFFGLSNIGSTGVIYVSHKNYGAQTITLTVGTGTHLAPATLQSNGGGPITIPWVANGGSPDYSLVNANAQAVKAIAFAQRAFVGSSLAIAVGGAIGTVTFTCVASGATGTQFNQGTSASATATNLAAAIRASSVAPAVGAVVDGKLSNVVDLVAKTPGAAGNAYTLTWTQGGGATSPDGLISDASIFSNAGNFVNGADPIQCSQRYTAPAGAAYCDIWPAVNASFQGTAYVSNVLAIATE